MAVSPEALIEAWGQAANSRDFDQVAPFIALDAEFHFTNGDYWGLDEIRGAFERTWRDIQDEAYTLSRFHWIGKFPTVAVCAYDFMSDGMVEGRRQIYHGRGTNVLELIGDRWQITYEHLSRAPDEKQE